MKPRGYYGVAVYNPKAEANIGSLYRTAYILGASFLAIIGKRYVSKASDTVKSFKHIPLFEYKTFEEFESNLPIRCALIGVELDKCAQDLSSFVHPERAVYLMGAEDYGIPPELLKKCDKVVQLKGEHSLNVSVAGSIVLYHRSAL